MKKLLKLLMLTVVAAGLVLAVGCGGKTETKDQSSNQAPTTAKEEAAKEETVNGVTKANPILVDKQAGTVTVLAQVNGKYLYEPTRHGVVTETGKNGEKPIFKAFADPVAFYNGLVEIGAKPGDNMTMENKDKTHVAGDALDVTVTWNGAGKDYKLDEVIKESNGKPLDIRFGGNLKNAQEKKTGCLICLDSCPVGITSNSTYTYGAVEDRKEVGFTGNKEVLPADGTFLAITLKVKKN